MRQYTSKSKKSIPQLLCLRQMGIGNARTLSYQVARRIYTGHTPLIAVLDTKAHSALDFSSERICYVTKMSGIPYVCFLQMNTSVKYEMSPVTLTSLHNTGSHGRIIGILLIEGSYPFFFEDIPPCDLESTLLVLKQSHLLRFQKDGNFLSDYDLSFVGTTMSTWEVSEEDDLLIIQSCKFEVDCGFKIAFLIFTLHPFLFHCCFFVTQNSFSNANSSLYGNITAWSGIDLSTTYLTVSTNKGYSLLFNFKDYALGLACGEVVQETPTSCLPCLLVLPGHFNLLSTEPHGGDFTVLLGDEPHNLFLTTIGKLLNATEYRDCVDQTSHSKNELAFYNERPNSYKSQRKLMILSCSRALMWEEELACDFVCSCSADLFPGDVNRLVVKEQGSLRVYQLPEESHFGEIRLFDNLLLRCGAPKENSNGHLGDFTKYGRRIQRPPKYRRCNAANYFCSYSYDLDLVSVLCIERLATNFLISSVSLYDFHDFTLQRKINLNVKVNLNGQDPTAADVRLSQGILFIHLTTDTYPYMLAFKFGSTSDSGVEIDLRNKFGEQESDESDYS